MAGAPTCAVLTGCRDLVFSVNSSSLQHEPWKDDPSGVCVDLSWLRLVRNWAGSGDRVEGVAGVG
jgi:hypothetical protein